MDHKLAVALVDQAVEAARTVTGPDEYEAVRALLARVAPDTAVALELGAGLLGSADPVARATGCDLLGLASEQSEAIREEAARAVLSIAAGESDVDVQWSIARALGGTGDRRAVPVLAALAGHEDSDVRFQVAVALPRVSADSPDAASVATMIGLTEDPDPEVRNWATFGLGFLMAVDTGAVRAALWARTADDSAEVRAEGVRGLARRRDRRAVPPLAALLDAEGGAHVLTFQAVAILGAPELLPYLLNYDPDDPGVAEALSACDPASRERLDGFAAALLGSIGRRLPGIDFAVYADWFEPGLTLRVAHDPAPHLYSVEALSVRAGGDPEEAARLVALDF